MTTTTTQNRSREDVRALLTEEVARYERAMNDPRHFSTIDPKYLRDYKAHVLRWIDCAPDGAVFLVAPLSGWRGEPFTPRNAQGPSGCHFVKAERDKREARGFDPRYSGANPIPTWEGFARRLAWRTRMGFCYLKAPLV